MSQNTTESEVLVKLVYAAESGDLSLLQTLLTGHGRLGSEMANLLTPQT